MANTIPKRTPDQIIKDRAFVADLFVRSYSYADIHRELNKELTRNNAGYTLSYEQIIYDIKQILIAWKKARTNDINDYIQADLKKYEKMERELWLAWERSKSDVIKVRTGSKEDYTITETTTGNPRYIELIGNVMKERAKLLGYDKPEQLMIINKDQEPDSQQAAIFQSLPPELLEQLTKQLLGIPSTIRKVS